jgi:hypothetical protein
MDTVNFLEECLEKVANPGTGPGVMDAVKKNWAGVRTNAGNAWKALTPGAQSALKGAGVAGAGAAGLYGLYRMLRPNRQAQG